MNQPSSHITNDGLAPVKRTWYHTTFFNVSIVAACAFIAPGLWAAMNGLGGAGAADPYYVNAANSVIFCLQFLVCIFGSTLIAKIGLRWAFVFGMTGFPVYAASVYCNVKYGNTWYLMVACVFDGITSGMFWLTEGAIVLAYPEKNRRGKYLAFWLASRIVGQMVGGAVTLGVNADRSEAGSISVETYLVFISIQAVGPFVAALLSPPHKVQRSNNIPVSIEIPKSIKEELRIMARVFCRKEVLLLVPMMFQSVFSEAFFSTYNATYFTVRARALASLVASSCVIISNFSLGFWLDWRKPSLHLRAASAFVLIYAFEMGLYIYAMIMTKRYEAMDVPPRFDWTDAGFGQGVCVYIFMLVGFNLMYDYLYWLVGTVNKNGADLIRLSAIIRGVESAGQAISYGINSINTFALSGAVAVNLSFFAACIIPAAFVVFQVGIVDGVKVHDIVQDEEYPPTGTNASDFVYPNGEKVGTVQDENEIKSTVPGELAAKRSD